ncbi:MAG: hypothetical protein ACTSO7_16730 [Candidatus Heimdallarchaeota archaeon]
MEEKDFISKIALSKEKERLGIIVRVEGSPTSVILSEQPHAIVKVKRLIFSPDYIELPLDLVIEKTDSSVQFKISEEDFESKKQLYRAERKQRSAAGKKSRSPKEDYNKNITKAVARQIRRW